MIIIQVSGTLPNIPKHACPVVNEEYGTRRREVKEVER